MTTPPSYISGTEISGGFTYSAGESVEVVSGGQAYDMTINSGGSIYIDKGGRATATTINNSGYGELSGGTAFNTVINAGGEFDVDTGKASGTKIYNDGVQSVYAGSSTSAVVFSGGVDDISSGGKDYQTAVSAGGGMHVYSGGKTYGTKVASGGVEFLTRGGVASNTVVSAGGSAILAGNVLAHDNFHATSGTETVNGVYKAGVETITFTGGDTVYTKITISGNTKEYYDSAGALELKIVRKGNELYYTDYTSSGSQTFSASSKAYKSNGVASGLVVQSGGTVVLDGGSAKNLTIDSGGTEVVGGTISINSAGGTFEFYISNVTVSGSHVGNGVTEIVKATDATAGAVISAGGTETVSSGGTAGSTTIDGGKLNLSAGAKLASKVSFAGTGGELVISAAKMPSTTISGFAAGDEIKLAGVTYVSGATATVTSAGVVTVTNNGVKYNLNIAGATVGENFTFNADSILTIGAAQASAAPAMTFISPAVTAAPPDWRPAFPTAEYFHKPAAATPGVTSAASGYGSLDHDISPKPASVLLGMEGSKQFFL